MPKTTQTHGSPKRAHPAPHPLGRMRPHFKATQERQQYEAAFPPAPPAAQCSRERGRSPPHSQPHIPSPSLTAGTPCRASCQCSRGRSDTRSSSSSRGAPVRSAPWQRDVGAAVLGAASGTGRKRQLKAKGERLQGRCLIRENLCLVGLCLASLRGGNLGEPGKPAGKEPWGNNGALQLLSCAHPAPVPRRPHPHQNPSLQQHLQG